MNRILRRENRFNNWIVSALINTVILVAVMLTTSMSYETNDDYVIAARIADGYAYVNFVNYYLCRGLIAVQGLLPSVNIYVVAQVAFAYVAFIIITKLFLDRCHKLGGDGGGKILMVILMAVVLIYSVDHYCTVQFTKTAAILMVCGMLTMIDSMTNRRHMGYYAASVIMLYLGVSFRIDGLPVVIGFAGIYLVAWVIINREKILSVGYLNLGKIVTYVILLALIGACYGYDELSTSANVSTPQLKAYKEFSEYRSDMVDYGVYDRYQDKAAEYEAAGFTENDIYLIDRWHFDYDGSASIENMKKITDIDSSAKANDKSITGAVKDFVKSTYSGIKDFSLTGVHIIILMLLALMSLIILRPRDWIYVAAIGAFAICMHLFLFYMQRPAYRGIYVIDLAATLWLLYYMSYRYIRPKKPVIDKIAKPAGIAVVVLILMLFIPVWSECDDRHDAASTRVMTQSLMDFAEKNSDTLLIFATSEKPATPDYADPLKVPGSCGGGNIIGTGSWGSMSPYVLDKMARYGIRNPIKDLIDSDSALYVGTSMRDSLTEYYNKWYGDEEHQIVMVQQEGPEGYSLWKVERVSR